MFKKCSAGQLKLFWKVVLWNFVPSSPEMKVNNISLVKVRMVHVLEQKYKLFTVQIAVNVYR